MGRVAEAISQYEQALRINPVDADARKNLARLRELPSPAGPGH
jgi:hypothetical protein